MRHPDSIVEVGRPAVPDVEHRRVKVITRLGKDGRRERRHADLDDFAVVLGDLKASSRRSS